MLGGRRSRGLYRLLFNFYIKRRSGCWEVGSLRGLYRLLFNIFIIKKVGMLGGRRSRGLLFNFYTKKKVGMLPIMYVTLKQGQMFLLPRASLQQQVEGQEVTFRCSSVSALSAGEYTTTLLVMVDRVKGGVRAYPTLTRLG